MINQRSKLNNENIKVNDLVIGFLHHKSITGRVIEIKVINDIINGKITICKLCIDDNHQVYINSYYLRKVNNE